MNERLLEQLHAARVDVALLSDPADVCYATGFEVPPPLDAGAAFAAGPSLALCFADGRAVLLVPNAYADRAAGATADETILVPTAFGSLEDVGDTRASLSAALRGALGGAERAGVDAASLPSSLMELLRDLETVDARPLLDAARRIKLPYEIELVRQAVALADAGQDALRELARAGRGEPEVLGDVVARVQAAAGAAVTWVGELATGARISELGYPAGPADRVLEAGDAVLMDLSVRRRGYWSDCCNTFVVDGEPRAAQRRSIAASRAAFEAGVEQLRPGRRACDVYEAADRELSRHGFRSAHYAGHQIGASVNESPRLVPYDRTPLEAGMIFALEPGAYDRAEGTGARLEKAVLVTGDGPEILSRFAWD